MTTTRIIKNKRDYYYCAYILESECKKRTYLGITNQIPTQRLRQHNGEIVGGARQTRTGRPWHLCATIGPFLSKSDALKFEKQGHLLNSKKRNRVAWVRLQNDRHITKWKRTLRHTALQNRIAQVEFLLRYSAKLPPYPITLSFVGDGTCSVPAPAPASDATTTLADSGRGGGLFERLSLSPPLEAGEGLDVLVVD